MLLAVMLFAAGAVVVGLGLLAWRRGFFERSSGSGRQELAMPLQPEEPLTAGDPAESTAGIRLTPLRLVEESEEVEPRLRG